MYTETILRILTRIVNTFPNNNQKKKSAENERFYCNSWRRLLSEIISVNKVIETSDGERPTIEFLFCHCI